MRSCFNLVVISLTLGYLASELDSSSLNVSKRGTKDSSTASNTDDDFPSKMKQPVSVTIGRPSVTSVFSTQNKISVTKGSLKELPEVGKNATNFTTKTNKLALIHEFNLNSETDLEKRDARRHRKRKRNRMLMALLMAYKLKFAALVPAIAGGLVLLVSTTALAGFFFALFAAVLGLKAH